VLGRKRELILFSLLSDVFSHRVFTAEVFNEVNNDRGICISVLCFVFCLSVRSARRGGVSEVLLAA